MEESQNEVDWLEYFSGGVPASIYFQLTLSEVIAMVRSLKKQSQIFSGFEICYVALFSYFEAFCKDQFAAILNIAPELLLELKKKKFELSVDASRALLFQEKLPFRFGTLLTEELDFGSAKSINFNYNSLLGISPFSKKESKQFEKLLFDRHLLVHHGGAITTRYAEQMGFTEKIKEQVFWNSIRISQPQFDHSANFLETIAHKISTTSCQALKVYFAKKKIPLTGEKKKAVESLESWDWENF